MGTPEEVPALPERSYLTFHDLQERWLYKTGKEYGHAFIHDLLRRKEIALYFSSWLDRIGHALSFNSRIDDCFFTLESVAQFESKHGLPPGTTESARETYYDQLLNLKIDPIYSRQANRIVHLESVLYEAHKRNESLLKTLEEQAEAVKKLSQNALAPTRSHVAPFKAQSSDYSTRLLAIQARAIQKFWINYDPTEPDTAPDSSAILNWLQEQGCSKREAESIDLIIRHDSRKSGGAKPKT